MYWPRSDTRVVGRYMPRPFRSARLKAQMDVQASRLLRAYPYACTLTRRRISAPLVMFSLPSRVEHARRETKPKRDQ